MRLRIFRACYIRRRAPLICFGRGVSNFGAAMTTNAAMNRSQVETCLRQERRRQAERVRSTVDVESSINMGSCWALMGRRDDNSARKTPSDAEMCSHLSMWARLVTPGCSGARGLCMGTHSKVEQCPVKSFKLTRTFDSWKANVCSLRVCEVEVLSFSIRCLSLRYHVVLDRSR